MAKETDRRNFLKSGAAIATAVLIGKTGTGTLAHAAQKTPAYDIVDVKGSDRFKNTQKALSLLGGMKKFIPANGSIGLLANSPSWWKNPGSYTHPDITLAVILMCMEAGAKEIHFLQDPAKDYWQKTPLGKTHQKKIDTVIKCSQNFIEKQIPKGKSLKKVKIVKDLFDCDAYINLPIIKNHTGTNMTCALKNLMGANSNGSNQFFHKGSGATEDYGDVEFLSQCIADLNTLKKPVLCVVDASEVLLTNGPAGPGKISKLNKVVAGADPVAIDAYCAGLIGLNPKDIIMIGKAHAHGLGEKDLKKKKIKQAQA